MINFTTLPRDQILNRFHIEHHHQLSHHDKLNAYNAFTNMVVHELQNNPQTPAVHQQIINTARVALKMIQEHVNHGGQHPFADIEHYGESNRSFFKRLTSGNPKKILEIICCHRSAPLGNFKFSLWNTNYTNIAQEIRQWLNERNLDHNVPQTASWHNTFYLQGVTEINEVNSLRLNLPYSTQTPLTTPLEVNLILQIINNYNRINAQRFSSYADFRAFVVQASEDKINQFYRPNSSLKPTLTTHAEFEEQVKLTAKEFNALSLLNQGNFELFEQFARIGFYFDKNHTVEFRILHPTISYLILHYQPELKNCAANGSAYEQLVVEYQHYHAERNDIIAGLTKIYAHYQTLLLADRENNNHCANGLLLPNES